LSLVQLGCSPALIVVAFVGLAAAWGLSVDLGLAIAVFTAVTAGLVAGLIRARRQAGWIVYVVTDRRLAVMSAANYREWRSVDLDQVEPRLAITEPETGTGMIWFDTPTETPLFGFRWIHDATDVYRLITDAQRRRSGVGS
jgi:hypothetical protein